MRRSTETTVILGVLAGLMLVILTSLSSSAFARRAHNAGQVWKDSLAMLRQSEQFLSAMKDAETGQRGYLLTGDERHLDTYNAGRASAADAMGPLRAAFEHAGLSPDKFETLKAETDRKLAELAETVSLRRAGKTQAAIARVTAGDGKSLMDVLRTHVSELSAGLEGRAADQAASAVLAERYAGFAILLRTLLLFAFLLIFAWLVMRDLAARTRAETALAQNQSWLRTTLLSIGDGVIATDADGRITLMNAVAEKLTGWTTEQAGGRPHTEIFRIINESSRQDVQSPVDRVIREGAVVGLANHTVLIDRQGNEHPIDDSGAPIRGPDGGLTGVVLVFRDISERNRAEKELRESELFNRSILNSSGDCIKVLDTDGRLVSLNHQGMCAMEIDDFEAVRGTYWPSLWGDNTLLATDAVSTALAGGEGRFQGPCPTAKGTLKWWDVLVTPIRDESGRIASLVATSRDITALVSAQEAVRERDAQIEAMFNQVLVGIAQTDLQGRYLMANDRYCKMVGRSRDELVGMRRSEVVHPDDRARSMTLFAQIIAQGGGFDIEKRYVRPDGSHVWVTNIVKALTDPDGRVRTVVTVAQDISERKLAEAERDSLLAAERAARSDAERISRVKDEFVATLSHELRTPLNAILGWAQLLRSGPRDPADLDGGLETIERNARIQSQMIEDLLDMSRIISGKVRLDVQRIDLPRIVTAAIDTIRPAADAKQIRIQTVLDPRTSTVNGDPTRLQQVVWNLLSNAVKFTPRGGKVQVVLARVNSHVEITISDTGCGIKPEFLPHVFERFRQEDASTTRRFGGLGLGLAIARQLIELHGGTLRAHSDGEGKGSTFTAELPLNIVTIESDHERIHPGTPRAARLDDASADLRGIKVLVVDDEHDSRELLRRILRERSAEVVTAGSVREALDAFAAFRPGVVLSDIGMPEQDGYELIRRIRAMPAADGGTTPAGALTALARSEDRTRALLAGYQVHLAKPVEPSELVAAVASLAGRNRG